MFRTDLFKGKRFLVTGGGTGLGRIMMEKFVELGADCVICGRRGGVLEETAREVMAKYPGRRVDTHAVDIRVATAVEEMIEAIWASGPLDGLVNNAAGNFISQTKDLSPRAFDAIANIVLHSTFYTTNACGKRWIADKRKASVLSILTTWVWTGSPFVVPSAMSKAGVAVTDVLTGLYACASILACLHARALSGHGYAIDLALLDCAVGDRSDDGCDEDHAVGLRRLLLADRPAVPAAKPRGCAQRHPAERHCAWPLPHRGRVGAAQSHERGRRQPLHRAQSNGPRRPPQ